MVRGLLILNSSYSGARDLWWPDDPLAVKGYNVYRAYDYPTNWTKLNPYPLPGHFYRDQSKLEPVKYEVQPSDWVDAGEMGMRIFKLPDEPYAEVVKGRPVLAFSPEAVRVIITYNDGTTQEVIPGQVSGFDRMVTLRVDNTLPVGGAVSAFPITNFANAVAYQAIYKKLTNYVDIATSLTKTFYSVVPIGHSGELHKPGAMDTEVVSTLQIDRMDYMQKEFVRRNAWLFEQVGEPAYLMFRRTRGEHCGCRQNMVETPVTACESCFETGIVGGFFGPYDFLYIDPDSGAVRTLEEGGVKVERTSVSYLGPTPIVQDGDLIIRRNGERLVVNGTQYTSPRGVILQQQFNTQLLPLKDTRYLIPITDPDIPVIYNPASQPDLKDGRGGAEPIFSVKTMPNKRWENPDPQIGRTTTWGNIQS